MISKKIFNIILIYTAAFAVLSLTSCTSSESLCESANTADNSNCKVQNDLGLNSQFLEIKFTDIKFFDQNSSSWFVVGKSDFESAKVESSIPLYSDTAATTAETAISSSALADSQYTNVNSAVKNEVPYIRVEAKGGVTYSYRYRKYDTLGSLKYEKLGSFIKNGDYAYLPLVNSSFDNQLYTPGTPVGTQYKNLFTITATSGAKTGLAKEVEIITTASVQNTEYQLSYASDTANYTLDKRWLSYRKPPTYAIANDNFGFVTLTDRSVSSELTDLDTRIVFKDDFKITIDQILFDEVPFQLENFVTTGSIIANRGYSFNTNTISLNSMTDFQHSIYFDTIKATQTSSKIFTVNAFPAGKKFDVKFNINFNQNAAYSADANSKGFHYPLQPVCKADKGQNYQPWIDEVNRDNAKNSSPSLFNAICHLDQSANITVDPANNITNTALIDTWYNYFSYAPYRPDKKELGHFFGLRNVTFRVSGCYKIEVKDVGSATWAKRTTGNSNCGDSNSTSDWLVFTAEKTFTIFDNGTAYDLVLGLKPIIDRLKSYPLVSKPNLKINNEKLNGNLIRHLY